MFPSVRSRNLAVRNKLNECDVSPDLSYTEKEDRRITNVFFESNANKFQVFLNVKHFKPSEIEVKIVDNFVVVHGKHEEKEDDHGFISREFTRRYKLPDDVEPEKVTSSLSSSRSGVLVIEAPRKMIDPPKNERILPIQVQTIYVLGGTHIFEVDPE